MPHTQKAIWELLRDSARELTQMGQTPFTRCDLISSVQKKKHGCPENSINPMIQGITDNLRGGAPGGVGKNILHSVGRGQFMLRTPDNKSAGMTTILSHKKSSIVTTAIKFTVRQGPL